jgi:hypothetical protein
MSMKQFILITCLFLSVSTWAQRGARFTNLSDALKNRDSAFYLDFNGHALSQLPDTLFSLTNLESLDLCNCSLSQLPEKIGQLKNLKWLRLNYNQLTALPESIGQLTKLEELYLNNNQLGAVPVTLCNLKNLRVLTMDDNHLTVVPECVKDFEQLEYFSLSGNKLMQEPSSVGPMEFSFSDTVWNKDKSKAVFLATSKGLARNAFGFYLHTYEIRMFDAELAVNATLVRSTETHERPEDMLTNFRNFFFSPDSRYVYFIVGGAWEKTDALHRVNTTTLKAQFVVDAFSYIVIGKGPHKGSLLVSRLFYNDGGPDARFWLISSDGKTRNMLTNDEAVQFGR